MLQLLSPDNAYSGANLLLLLVLVLLSTVFFICFSGFVKYNIVLNIIKNAVGTQQIPPAIVVNLLAALMALNSVWPDIKPGIDRVKPYFSEQSENEQMFDVFYDQSLEEEKPQNITMYYLASHMFEFFPELLERSKIKTNRLLSMIDIPLNFDETTDTFKYFLGSLVLDLYQGFELGLKLYLIFVSIDFLIAVILSGVGMTMLSPTVISTPVKLAVFYFSDSWTLLFRALA
ncbi:type III secretion system protein [Vibrio cholerae]|uniref:flagellar type III secretion system pore protein FliP n=1 Tax=Vibrio cholerae TaxID=666 RepID=UPI00157B145F|nr:flagellar type III secretion system pore protein FliP [Vibrio cholerae]EGQ8095627.1 EscR/YscR/HrcR family type III secretion system export apparatus protein [Vibrio cholerae]EGQ9189297.1 EscR/YscR/HrcR family type III secretion system export apparatus protein [Vibrio cholerae]EGR0593620.1 EscR/YscR/HrcR family type III secretion system export apparatus protein [Vibrio cholerae]EGR1263070.1 EscR/YscR/HrcR family type III secretion system export apparatus protein [Vibrio cholerae]EJL6268051.1